METLLDLTEWCSKVFRIDQFDPLLTGEDFREICGDDWLGCPSFLMS